MDFDKLPTEVKEVNRQLIDHFGVDTDTGNAIWRVSWSWDQFENRLSDYTPGGIALLHPIVQHLRKYQHIEPKCWILERLVFIPEVSQAEIPTEKKSYECMQAFDRITPRVPSFEACKFVVDVVYAALGRASLEHYKHPDADDPIEAKHERVNKIMEELYGDESFLLGRTITGEAVAYTGEPKIVTSQEEK